MTKPDMIKNVTSLANAKYAEMLAKRDRVPEKDFSQELVEAVLEAYGDYIIESIRKNEKERIPVLNLGSFKGKVLEAQSGNMNGKDWSRPRRVSVKFSVNSKTREL